MSAYYFPCLCKHCCAIVQVNFLAEQKQCPKCKTTKIIPYDDPTLSGDAGERILSTHTVTNWMDKKLKRKLILTDGTYKCSQCNQMTLRFADNGYRWD
ncbi:MAG: hypothetical protein P9M06_05320 [Candidatus Saelkia tenebricola]|nr:hypothetical protein [Candidatus Saelkia tenebricola]